MALPSINVTPGSGATINTLPNAPAVTANSVSVALATDQASVPITASALPLPAGAATAANQASEISSLAAILAAIQATDAAISITNRSGYVNGAVASATVAAGGTGYAVNDTLTLPTGVGVTTPAVLKVAAATGGAITSLTVVTPGVYTAPVTGNVTPASTSGAGAGAAVSLASFAPLSTQVAASNTSRQYLAIRNESASLNLGASLSGGASFGGAGTTIFYPNGGGYEWGATRIPSNALTVIGQQAFQQFTAWEG